MNDNVTGEPVDHVPSATHSSRFGVFCDFTTLMCLRSHELRSSAFYDIFNDSYDVTEEKTADRSAG